MLIVQQVFELRERGDSVAHNIGPTQVELCIAEVQIAVRQQQRISEVRIEAVEERRVIADAPLNAAVNFGRA